MCLWGELREKAVDRSDFVFKSIEWISNMLEKSVCLQQSRLKREKFINPCYEWCRFFTHFQSFSELHVKKKKKQQNNEQREVLYLKWWWWWWLLLLLCSLSSITKSINRRHHNLLRTANLAAVIVNNISVY